MRFPDSFLDEIRARILTSDVVGRRVNLKHSSSGEFTGLCPFHNEKTPSFSVSDKKGFYHCFGCSAHGDILKFVMQTEGLVFFEAVKKLADEAGLQLPEIDAKEEEHHKKVVTLYDVMECATSWFESQLKKNHSVQQYLTERGINENIAGIFRLGFSTDSGNLLKKYMLSMGYTEQQLIETGLVIPKDSGSYDRFRGRLMFPIMDAKNRILAFGGRILGEGQPKYLNSPETELFHKGRVLYGLNHARQVAFENGNIVVVEGYMDVIAMHKVGIKNVVAPLGTSLTDDHMKMIWRIAKEPIICLDGDAAGKRAMTRAANNSLPLLLPGYSLRFAMLPSGEDPDDVIKRRGVKAIREILNSAIHLSDALLDITLSGKNLSTPEKQAAFEHKLMKLAENIQDSTVQNYYRSFFRDKLWQMKRSYTYSKKEKSTSLTASHLSDNARDRYEKHLITIITEHPELLLDSNKEEDFMRIELEDTRLNELRNAIVDFSDETENPDKDSLNKHLVDIGFSKEIEYLVKSMFRESHVEHSEKPEIVEKYWNFTIASYRLTLMQEEYDKEAGNATSMTLNRMEELEKQTSQLKKLVKKEYMSYEDALD